jgi:hypothetical protein
MIGSALVVSPCRFRAVWRTQHAATSSNKRQLATDRISQLEQIGEHFQPALGFVPRVGIQTTDVSLAFQPRPDAWGIRQVFFQVNPIAVTNLQNRLESASLATTPFNVQTESGDHLEWDWTPIFEGLDTPFAIATSVLIPPGAYQWTRFRAAANTATKRPWVVDARGRGVAFTALPCGSWMSRSR